MNASALLQSIERDFRNRSQLVVVLSLAVAGMVGVFDPRLAIVPSALLLGWSQLPGL